MGNSREVDRGYDKPKWIPASVRNLDHTLNLVRILDKGQLVAAPLIHERNGRRVAVSRGHASAFTASANDATTQDRHGTTYNLASYVISISVTTGNCPERTT